MSEEAICLGCACTDARACFGGCAWLYVDRERGVGICSNCGAGLDAPERIIAEASDEEVERFLAELQELDEVEAQLLDESA